MPQGLSVEQKSGQTEPAPAAAAPSGQGNRVAELKVSAHLMTLEAGLFCVFLAPGSPPPDPVTALPGVRITPAPGIAGRPEAVSVSTFREDGWLNGTAALVRVTDGTAQILVTIYQDKGQDAAPRLQVLRLSGDPVAPQVPAAPVAPAPPPPAAEAAAAMPEVMAHIQRMGDVTCDLGAWLGVKGSRQWVEGFGLAPRGGLAPEDIEYQAVLGRNWLSPWVEGGKYCGSRGMALPLLGFKVRLKNQAAKTFDVSYSATFIDGSAAGPLHNGETCESESMAALESFQIVLTPKTAGATEVAEPKATGRSAEAAAGTGKKPAARAAARPSGRTRSR